MQINQADLARASQAGSLKVSEAFSKFAKQPVSVTVSEAKMVPISAIFEALKIGSEKSVVVYTQVISGIPGVSMLMLEREQALTFIDLLSGQPRGTTGIMLESDRSAIKETLNILSNAYLEALSSLTKQRLLTTIPHMILAGSLQKILEQDQSLGAGQAVIFKTVLSVATQKIEATLFMIFSEKLAESLSKINN